MILTRQDIAPLAHAERGRTRLKGTAGAWYRTPQLWHVLIAAAVILGAMIILAAAALPRELDHDEHQFVASGVLLARNGLLPYIDYPYFHVPNLVFLYAAIDLFAPSPFLAARVLSLAFALVTLSLVWLLVWSSLSEAGTAMRVGMAGAAVIVSAFSPLSLYTVGRAWNHDPAVAMFLLAFVLVDRARRVPPAWPLLLGGLVCGLAVGTRLSFAPAAVGLAILIVIGMTGESRTTQARAMALFLLGGILGLLPTIVMAALAPDAFIFGNLTYAGLNEAYRTATGYTSAMDLTGKARFIFEKVLFEPRDAILFVSFNLMVAAEAWRVFVRRGQGERQPLAIGLLMPLLLIGALAPTPSWYQYFFLLVPFSAAAAAIAAGRLHMWRARIPVGGMWMALAALTVIWLSRGEIGDVRKLVRPQSWTPTIVRQIGGRIEDQTAGGPVLTLSPIYVLEGGGAIYEEFANGPFAWRVGSFVPEDRRERLHLVSPQDLDGILTSRPPAGILVGKEADLEGPMIAYAEANGFKAVEVGDGLTLWVNQAQ